MNFWHFYEILWKQYFQMKDEDNFGTSRFLDKSQQLKDQIDRQCKVR